MNLLSFDTSGAVMSVGAYRDEKELAVWRSEASARHSGALAPAIKRVLDEAGWRPADLEGIAVGIGPGSFTGLRVGLAAAKAMAYVLGLRIAGVPSLDAAAWSAAAKGPVAVALDAKRGMIYAGLYEKSPDRLKVISKSSLTTLAAFEKKIPKNAFRAGSGLPGAPEAAVSAEAVAVLGAIAFSKKSAYFPADLLPLYLRPKDCNVTLPGKKMK
jgi:tRNA threonylcarbamoyladenosine biosynthesis protein TsaB